MDEYIAFNQLERLRKIRQSRQLRSRRIDFLGGAGIVAADARGFGAEVNFFYVEKDEAGKFSRGTLKDRGIIAHLYTDESRQTIRKERLRAQGKMFL